MAVIDWLFPWKDRTKGDNAPVQHAAPSPPASSSPPLRWILYTHCASGFRYAVEAHSVLVSYDAKCLAHAITHAKEHQEQLKNQSQTMKHLAQHVPDGLSHILNHQAEHDAAVMEAHETVIKRLATAEAVVDGNLAREVRITSDWQEVINYTKGVL